MITQRDLVSLLLKIAGIVFFAWLVMTAGPKVLTAMANGRAAGVSGSARTVYALHAAFWYLVIPLAVCLYLIKGSDTIAAQLVPGEEPASVPASLDTAAVLRVATSMVGLVLVVTTLPALGERVLIYLALTRNHGGESLLMSYDRFFFYRLGADVVRLLLGVGLFYQAELVYQLREWHRSRQRDEQFLLETELETVSSDTRIDKE